MPFRIDHSRSFLLPFLIVAGGAILLFLGDTWLLDNGSVLSLQGFLRGEIEFANRLVGISSSLLTKTPSLFYTMSGGSDYKTYAFFYRLGLVLHVFLPFLFMGQLRKKEEALAEWIIKGLNFYAFSFIVLCMFCFFRLSSSLYSAHTFCWLMFFAYQARLITNKNRDWTENYFINFALFAALSNIFCIIAYLILLLTSFSDKTPRVGKIKERYFLGFLFLASFVAFLFFNRDLYPELGFINEFTLLPTRPVFKIYLIFAVAIFLLLRFRVRGLFLIPEILLLTFVYYNFWAPLLWTGLVLALLAIGIILFLFIQDKVQTIWGPFPVARLFILFSILTAQTVYMRSFMNDMGEYVSSLKEPVSFQVGYKAQPEMYQRLMNPLVIRMLTMNLQMINSQSVSSYVERETGIIKLDLVDRWGKDEFVRQLSRKKIKVSESVERELSLESKPFN